MLINVNVIPLLLDPNDPVKMQEDLQFLLRYVRDIELRRSDWTQMSDSPLSDSAKLAWAAYRQELRDLPSTVGVLDISANVEFPDPPQ